MKSRGVVMTQVRLGLPVGRRLTEADRPFGVLQTLVDTGAARWLNSPADTSPDTTKRGRRRAVQPDGDDAAG